MHHTPTHRHVCIVHRIAVHILSAGEIGIQINEASGLKQIALVKHSVEFHRMQFQRQSLKSVHCLSRVRVWMALAYRY